MTVLGLGAGHLIFDILMKWDWDSHGSNVNGKGAEVCMNKHDDTNVDPCCA
jgi:hypothetical protein